MEVIFGHGNDLAGNQSMEKNKTSLVGGFNHLEKY